MNSIGKIRKYIADFIIILFILFFSISLIILNANKVGDYAIVTVDGKETGRYDLDTNQTIMLNSSSGGQNELVIKDGSCMIDDANCNNRLCIKQGAINRDGQSIVCLPHHLVVSIESYSKNDVDGVAG